MCVDFNEPFDALIMRYFWTIVLFSQILHHVQEVLQKVKAIVEIYSFFVSKTELWNNLVTI